MNTIRSLALSLKLWRPFYRLIRSGAGGDAVFFHQYPALSGPAAVRELRILELAESKRVLHFGFLDAPFSEDKISKASLLHLKIMKTAAYLYGVDIDADALTIYRKYTQDTQNEILDIQSEKEVFPDSLVAGYDLILFSEVLEHLPAPFEALRSLHQLCKQNPGAKLCVTTPNAFSVMGLLAAIEGNEVVHPTHYYYFSPYTLERILKDAGFTQVHLELYSSPNLLDAPGLTKHGIIAVCEP